MIDEPFKLTVFEGKSGLVACCLLRCAMLRLQRKFYYSLNGLIHKTQKKRKTQNAIKPTKPALVFWNGRCAAKLNPKTDPRQTNALRPEWLGLGTWLVGGWFVRCSW